MEVIGVLARGNFECGNVAGGSGWAGDGDCKM